MTRRTASIAASLAVLGAAVAALVATLHIDRVAPESRQRPGHPFAVPFVIFRTLAPSDDYGHVEIMRLEGSPTLRQLTGLSCTRVHFAGGRGICVAEELAANVPEHVAYVFDRSMTRGTRIALRGVPTRLRVSPNGQHAAITTYAEEETPEGERLATETALVDLRSGRTLADVRDFRIDNGRQPPLTGPLDVGGVTFERDSNRFFAFVSTPTERYLVAGSLQDQRMRVIRTGVACESLSPDGRKLVVKKPGPSGFWQLAVIDLRTWEERDLAQGPASVDDQVEWFDDQHVLYHAPDDNTTSLWMLPIDGVNGPHVFVKNAYSPSVQR
jgi:dipeptidyl aminopeptidase/acylaminoacyl peptidase